MRKNIILIFTLISSIGFAQELNVKKDYGGMFSLGVRTTLSTFNGHHEESNGLGVGGQFRIQFAERVNSDWFFDYINSEIGDYANRTDYHIGWSVLFYPTANQTSFVRPYILAGHCFDYTQMVSKRNPNDRLERWSSAVQGGAGVHFNLSERLDLSLVGQYMVHLGNEIHTELEGGAVHFHEENGASLEGHMLFHLGINYKIGDLW
ncbi:MAG: hypothetical protein ACO2Z9_07325 [Crocinitomicaceae bacterium]